MGNGNSVPGSHQGLSAGDIADSYRPSLEGDDISSVSKELKRSKSLRRSIGKRLRRKGIPKDNRGGGGGEGAQSTSSPEPPKASSQPPPPPPPPPPSSSSQQTPQQQHPPSSLSRESDGQKRKPPPIGDIQPLPTYVQDGSRKMDRLRKSIRSSLRKKNKDKNRGGSQAASTSQPLNENSKNHVWQQDEAAVRAGICSFQVKYLGCVEVFDSRGMQVCEEAIKVLKNSKRKSVRSILYIHGDGLRVVDDETKGLIVDQIIEKVSFCAPDRNYDKGFSYICRDGTTRRWMCHAFMAIKESGERLSHAVGCAFAICLERKQKRDKECNVFMTFDDTNSSFTRMGSFRQATITERLTDPQILKPSTPVPPSCNVESNPHAIARPHATNLMLQRQTSFKGFNQLAGSSPFKRQLSLRINELPSTLERVKLSSLSDGDGRGSVTSNQSSVNSIKEEVNECHQNEAITNETVNSMCQQVSQDLNLLTSSGSNVYTNSLSAHHQPHSLPFTIHSPSPLPTVPEDSTIGTTTSAPRSSSNSVSPILQPTKLDSLPNVKPVQLDNPWDFVPDQPKSLNNNQHHPQSSFGGTNSYNNNNITTAAPGVFSCPTNVNSNDSSSGISSTASQSITGGDEYWNSLLQSEIKKPGAPFISQEEIWSTKSSILDDPFDAEWAALATRRNNSKNLISATDSNSSSASSPTNPFRQNNPSIKKAFELQM